MLKEKLEVGLYVLFIIEWNWKDVVIKRIEIVC